MAVYSPPGSSDSTIEVKEQYDNFIGGEWVAPVNGEYFDNITPVTGQVFTRVARSTAEDIDKALDAAHAAKDAWGRTSTTDRSNILLKIADTIEANLEDIAVIETWDNGKAVRETLAADIPLAVDHFRYFAGAIRAQEGSISEIDHNTMAYHFHEPLGVVGQIIPWNFPILMGVWKIAPALAAGNCIVLKPAEQTPWSILKVVELIADLLPPGVLNVVNGFGVEAGKPLASSPRIAKIAFTGETTTGRLIMQYASQNIIPVTLELGGKSPNVFFDDVRSEIERRCATSDHDGTDTSSGARTSQRRSASTRMVEISVDPIRIPVSASMRVRTSSVPSESNPYSASGRSGSTDRRRIRLICSEIIRRIRAGHSSRGSSCSSARKALPVLRWPDDWKASANLLLCANAASHGVPTTGA